MKNNFNLASMSTSWHSDIEVRDVDKRITDSFNLHTQMLSREDKLKMSELFRDITVILEDHEKQVIKDVFTHFSDVLFSLMNKPYNEQQLSTRSIIDLVMDMQNKLLDGTDKL